MHTISVLLMSNSNTANTHSINTNSRLVWIDMEMSGLNPDHSYILEIASIVTDNHLQILAEGPNLAIHHPDHVLDTMDAWNQRHHRASGLTDRVKRSTITTLEAESQTLAFLKTYGVEKECPLCGNSIGQDRLFLRKYMGTLEQWLHYRNVDVSSFKEMIARWAPEKFTPPVKQGRHIALQDIRESIEEMRYYRSLFMESGNLS